jgi:hypothetical protein
LQEVDQALITEQPILHTAIGRTTREVMMSHTYEFHFQEGFTGEPVEISVDGKPIARFNAKTRLQLGLAHIERLELEPGQVVSICIEDLNLAQSVSVPADQDYIKVNRAADGLDVEPTSTLPGYL